MPPVSTGLEREARRLRFDEFEIDTAAARLRRNGATVRVEPRILALLVYLLDNRHRLITKDELNERVWGGAFVTGNALDRAVARLRKALGDNVREPRFIETVPTRGYRFLADVESEQVDAVGVARRWPRPAIVLGAASPTLIAAVLLLVVATRSRDAPSEGTAAASPERIVARQLTSSTAFEFAPSFSPDGASVAYTSHVSGTTAIWVRSLAPGGRDRELAETAGARVATWSPDGRWIAYDSYQGIWIIPPNGGSPRQVVERGGAPRWSPDGSTIVFQQSVEGVDINDCAVEPPSTLWSVRLDGSAPRQLTRLDEPLGGHGQPTYSSDGRRIAFVTASLGRRGELWTMSANGGDLRRVVAACQCRDPVFSPGGDFLYFVDYVDSQHGLWGVDATGAGPPRRLYEAPLRFLALSPDGRTLAASRHDLQSDLWTVEVEPETGAPSGREEPLARDTVYRSQFPVTSPDGQHLAFIANRAGNVPELWWTRLGGGEEELLATGAYGWPVWSADSQKVYYVAGAELRRVDVATRRVETVFRTELPWQTHAAVAPGGGAVAFSLTDSSGVTNVWTLDAAGRTTQVTSEAQQANFPTWSPDARFLAIEVKRSDGIHCGYVRAEGGEVVLITEGEEECFTGGWSPDGDKIAVARRPLEGPQEHWDVWWVSRTTREARRLTERPLPINQEFLRYPTWSVDGNRVWFELAQSGADIWLFELPGLAPS